MTERFIKGLGLYGIFCSFLAHKLGVIIAYVIVSFLFRMSVFPLWFSVHLPLMSLHTVLSAYAELARSEWEAY